MKERTKRDTERGITLVVLVITIIVMLILAGVAVKIATDGGLIDKTQDTSEEFTIEQEKEKAREGYLAYKNLKMVDEDATLTVEDSFSVTGNSTRGWIVTFKDTNESRTYKITKDGKVYQYDEDAEPLEDNWYEFTEEESKIIIYNDDVPRIFNSRFKRNDRYRNYINE